MVCHCPENSLNQFKKRLSKFPFFDDYKDLYIIFFSNYLVPLGVRMISKGADYCQIHNLFVSFGGKAEGTLFKVFFFSFLFFHCDT